MNTNHLSKTIESIAHINTLALFFLFPLFFLPLTSNFFEPNKFALLIIATSINLILWTIKIITQKTLRFTISPFSLPLFATSLVYLLSTFIASPNPYESLLSRGLFFPVLTLFTLITSSLIQSKKIISQALWALIGSATLLSFISIFQSLGFGLSTLLNNFLNLNLPQDLSFSPAGSPIAYLSFVLPVLVLSLMLAFNKKDSLEKIVLFLFGSVITTGTVLSLLYSLPGKDTSPIFLPLQYGYSIALDTLKGPTLNSLLGRGPDNFINAFNQTRPGTINTTELWNIRFTNSSSEFLQIITTTGLLGLIAWLYMAFTLFKASRLPISSTLGKLIKFTTISLFFLQLLIPGTYPLLATTYFMLLLWILNLKFAKNDAVKDAYLTIQQASFVRPEEENQPNPTNVMPYLVSAPVIILVAVTLYFTGKTYAAEIVFKQSLDAASQNDGTKTYNLQRQAIIQNPYISRYRRAYSATNLALANSISAKEELTDQDRQNVTQLIQQSIREAKAAVTLDPQNSANWETLILIYRNLINIAQNADQWTIASYAQAIQNDPVNPRLRLELGGVYYALGRYDQAIRLFQQAAELKPNWANAYYNLSYAHRQKGELETSFNYMRQVAGLVEPDTADYTKAQQDLEILAEQINSAPDDTLPAPQTQLQVPAPAPTPNPQNQVELPAEAGPDNLNTNPQTTPSPEPNPAPSPTPES